MTTEDFYLTLPSNTTHNASASAFWVDLPRMIRLTGDWEVALVELIYPYSWYNVDESNDNIYLGLETTARLITGQQNITGIVAKLKIGHYGTIEDLLQALSASISPDYKEKINFDYDKHANRVEIELRSPVVSLHMAELLYYMLGYTAEPYSDNRTKAYLPEIRQNHGSAPHPPDMRCGLSILYVYCDIVEHSVVGNKLAPLLREVAVEGKFGDIIDKIFIHPHYVPVLKKEFDKIEIAIKTDQNKNLALQYGKTLAKLHFRRRRGNLFSL